MDNVDEQIEYTFIPKILDKTLDEKITNKSDVMLFKSGLFKSHVTYTTQEEALI